MRKADIASRNDTEYALFLHDPDNLTCMVQGEKQYTNHSKSSLYEGTSPPNSILLLFENSLLCKVHIQGNIKGTKRRYQTGSLRPTEYKTSLSQLDPPCSHLCSDHNWI